MYFLVLNGRLSARGMAQAEGTGGCPGDGTLRRMGPPSPRLLVETDVSPKWKANTEVPEAEG